MKLKSNQSGVAHIAAIVLVVVVAVVGLVGWKIWDNKQSDTTDNATNSSQSSNTATDSDDDYLVIPEWGVRMKIAPELGDVSYKIDEPNVSLTASLQKSLSTSCLYAAKSAWGLSRIDTKTAKEKSWENEYPKVVGDYSYLRSYPQMGCENTDKDTMTKLDGGFTTMFNALETNSNN